MTTIADQFNALLAEAFPNGCDLTNKRRAEWERLFFCGFHAAMQVVIQNSDKPQAEAELHMDRLFDELNARMAKNSGLGGRN